MVLVKVEACGICHSDALVGFVGVTASTASGGRYQFAVTRQ